MAILFLLAQCLSIFLASILVGSLPLMFRSAMSGRTLKGISVMGMGLLVGAALCIIIPEGVSTLYSALPAQTDRSEAAVEAIGLSLLCGFALMLLIESLTPHPPHSPPSSPISSPDSADTPMLPSSDLESNDISLSRPQPQHLNSHTPIIPKRLHIRDSDGKRNTRDGGIAGLNATLGLVIHGAADGIALGASSLSDKGSLGFIVFLAVLVHKGPTALGLTTTLLSLSVDPPGIRKRLFIFSCAAPLGAIITFTLVNAFGANLGKGQESGVDGLSWWTGIALLFSGGSFLYVATVIQPLSSPSPNQHSHSHHSHMESDNQHDEALGKYTRTALLVCGMVMPALLGYVVGEDY